jgi:hypothetical protein
MHQKCRLLPRERFAALPGAIWGVSLQIFLVVEVDGVEGAEC